MRKNIVGAIILRKIWMSFLSHNQDLIRTGFELVEPPQVKFIGYYPIPYDSRRCYEVEYSGRRFFIWESDIERWVYE